MSDNRIMEWIVLTQFC